MAENFKITSLQFKRGTKERLELVLIGQNKPQAGEPILEVIKDTNGLVLSSKLKVGDGQHDYKDLPYLSGDETKVDNQSIQIKSNGDLQIKGFDLAGDGKYLRKSGTSVEWVDIETYTKSEIDTKLGTKQNVISDLDTIREGAALGKTAIQEHQDISGKADVSYVNTQLANKQDRLTAGSGINLVGNNISVKDSDIDYNNLKNKPAIPIVGNGTIIIKQGGVLRATFSVNQTEDEEINLDAGTIGAVTQINLNGSAFIPVQGVVSLPNYPTTLPASDVYEWAKQPTKPSYTSSEVGALPNTTKYAGDASLTFNPTVGEKKNVLSIQLKDQNGDNIGTGSEVELPIDQVVESGYYDEDKKEIVLVLTSGDEIRIPVKNLVKDLASKNYVDTELAKKQNTISDLSTIRSGASAGATAVQPSDIADMATKTWVEGKGYLTEHQSLSAYRKSVDQDVIDAGLSGRITTIEGKEPGWDAKQDALTAGSNIQINNNVISATDTTYTAGTNVSIDSNNKISVEENEDTFIFEDDIKTMYTIGKYAGTLKNPVTIAAKGKSFKNVWNDIFQKEDYPSTVQPSVVIASSNIGKFEVGSNVIIQYTTTFNAGSYTYGPATGVTASNYKVKFNEQTLTTNTGSFDAVQVKDDTSLLITGTFNHTAGAMPKTNIGNDYPTGQIKVATSKEMSPKGTLSGFRKIFWGYANTTELTSDVIRGLAHSKENAALNKELLPKDTTAKCIIIAAPKDTRTLVKVTMPSSSYAEVTGQFIKQTNPISVKGNNDYLGKDYDVWVYAPAAMDGTYEITFS